MRLVVTILASSLVLSGCTSLLTPSGSAATRWAKLEKQREARAAGTDVNQICKTMTVMGSNFPQKVCSTQEEWDQFDEDQLKKVEDVTAARRAGNTDAGFEQ